MAVAFELDGEDERDAFAALYRQARSPLVAYCRRLLGPSGDAEELAQEALVRAWRSWDRDGSRPFWPWVLTVARNLVVDQHRRTSRRADLTPLAAVSVSGPRFPQPEDEAVLAAEYETVRAAFAGLPDPYRIVVELHHVEGRSYQEIAELQQVSTETVRGMLRRGRQALRAAYLRLEAAPVVVAITAAARRTRGRAESLAARTQSRLAESGALLLPADALRSAIVLALVVGGGAGTIVPTHPAPPALAVAAAPGLADRGAPPVMAGADGSTETARPPDDAPGPPTSGGLPLGLSDTATTPEEAWFEEVVASRDGRTLFASGTSSTGCPTVSCPVLFQSEDGGRTWRRLRAAGFRGGRLFLPPAWPADRRLFALGQDALMESADAGATFVARTPAGRTGAMSPGFSSGDPVVWVGFAPGWVYHDDTKAVTPLDMWPVPVADYATYAFSPDWPTDRRVLLGGWNLGPDGLQTATVSVCRDSRCGLPNVVPGLIGSPQLLAAPSFPRTGLAWAWAGDRLQRSTDGGHTFMPLRLPGPGQVAALVATGGDRLHLALSALTPGGPVGGLYVSDDAGDSWRQLGAGTRLARGATAVTALPGGRLVAALPARSGGGLVCSSDSGTTWRSRC